MSAQERGAGKNVRAEDGEKQCLLDMTWLLHCHLPVAGVTYTKPTRSVDIPAGSTSWTQWIKKNKKKKKGKGMKCVRGAHVGGTRGVGGEVGVDIIKMLLYMYEIHNE